MMRESGGRVSGGDRLHTRGKARDLPRGGVAVQHAAGHSALDFRLRVLQRFARAVGVTGGDCQLDLFDEGADTAHARAIDGGATPISADPLFGGDMIGHGSIPYKSVELGLMADFPSIVKRF